MNDKNVKPADQTAASANGRQNKAQQASDSPLSYLHDFVWLLAAALILFVLCFRVVIVSGPSMRDTLLDGDYIFLVGNLFFNEPEQGDIIVACKDTFHGGEPIVKRVIATEGQTVDIDFVRGIVYVDGVALDEPYTLTPTNLQEGMLFPVTVEENCVFVMGDNRNDSKDSRSKEIGMIDHRQILGKAVFLLFPGDNEGKQPRDYKRIGALE